MNDLLVLKQKINIANIHKNRIVENNKYLNDIFPLSLNKFYTLSVLQQAFLDSLEFRFTKMFDLIGTKIFPLTLKVMQEDVDTSRFLDVLNKLEKTRLIESKDFWLELREIRNYIAHDYPDNDKYMIEATNQLYAASKKLVVFFDTFALEVSKLPL